MKIYLVQIETTTDELRDCVVSCSGIISLYNNLKKSCPELRRIIGQPERINLDKEIVIDLSIYE